VVVDTYAAADGQLDDVARTLQESLGLSDSITAAIVLLLGRVLVASTEMVSPDRTTSGGVAYSTSSGARNTTSLA
jgi:hypothetical protein